jgi:hypothetical protein
MFVVGADTDTPETVRATVDFALHHEIDTMQMMMLTTLPGTSFDVQMRAEGRVLTDDYSLYDGHHCVIAPQNMTPYQLQMETWKGMLRFYSKRGWLRMINRQIARNLGRIVGLFFSEWRFTTNLPKILALCAINRPSAAFRVMRGTLSKRGMTAIYELFGVAVFRRYGREQLLKFTDQVDSMRHLDLIRSLPAWSPPTAQAGHPSLQVLS